MHVMHKHVTKGGAREIYGVPVDVWLDTSGVGHMVLAPEVPTYDHWHLSCQWIEGRKKPDTLTNIEALCASVPPGTRVRGYARLVERVPGKKYWCYSLKSGDAPDAFPNNGAWLDIKAGTPTMDATVALFEAVFDEGYVAPEITTPEAPKEITAPDPELGVWVSEVTQEKLRERIKADAPRDFGISESKADWWAQLIIHLLHEPAA